MWSDFIPTSLSLQTISCEIWTIFDRGAFAYDVRFIGTAKRILERRVYSDFIIVCQNLIGTPEFKAKFLFFWHLYGLVFYLESIGILAGNLNSGCSYLITAVRR